MIPLLDQDPPPGLDVAVVLLKELGISQTVLATWLDRRVKPKSWSPPARREWRKNA